MAFSFSMHSGCVVYILCCLYFVLLIFCVVYILCCLYFVPTHSRNIYHSRIGNASKLYLLCPEDGDNQKLGAEGCRVGVCTFDPGSADVGKRETEDDQTPTPRPQEERD